jgi:hypothetical protein
LLIDNGTLAIILLNDFTSLGVTSRLLCCSSLILISATFVRGQAPPTGSTPAARVDRIEIVEKGLYRVQLQQKVEDPRVLGGSRYVHSKGELIQDTATIPAVKGTQFGFRYVVVGEPKGTQVPTRIVAHYPEGGRQNPNNGKIAQKDEFPQAATIGGAPNLFFFNMMWGMVPGVWTIEVWSQDRKLAEQKFTLVQP